jgi:hypothetical protein
MKLRFRAIRLRHSGSSPSEAWEEGVLSGNKVRSQREGTGRGRTLLQTARLSAMTGSSVSGGLRRAVQRLQQWNPISWRCSMRTSQPGDAGPAPLEATKEGRRAEGRSAGAALGGPPCGVLRRAVSPDSGSPLAASCAALLRHARARCSKQHAAQSARSGTALAHESGRNLLALVGLTLLLPVLHSCCTASEAQRGGSCRMRRRRHRDAPRPATPGGSPASPRQAAPSCAPRCCSPSPFTSAPSSVTCAGCSRTFKLRISTPLASSMCRPDSAGAACARAASDESAAVQLVDPRSTRPRPCLRRLDLAAC